MEIISIGQSKKAFDHFPEHQHGYWEILLNVSGSGTFYAGSEDYHFKPGTIAVIPPYTPHSKESEDGFTDRSLFLKNFRNIGRPGVKVFQDDSEENVKKIFDMAQYFYEQKADETDNITPSILNALGDLLYQVLVSYYNQSRKKDIRLEGAIELMHKNLSDPNFSLSEAVRSSGYSMGYFRKIFKEMTGQSPVAYFHTLRITHAKSLFQQYGPSRTIKDIAYQCGFEDPLYFSRVFKQLEGISPQQYLSGMSLNLSDEDIHLIALDTPEELL